MPYSLRDFRHAFRRALAHRPTRALWLASLRQQVTFHGPPVPIEDPEDLAAVVAVEAQLPTSEAILHALVDRLRQDMPEWFQGIREPDTVVALRLMRLVVGYQTWEFPDPLRPWGTRGPEPGSHHQTEAAIEADMADHYRTLAAGDDPVFQKDLARSMHLGGEWSIQRRLRRIHLTWRAFKKNIRHKTLSFSVSCPPC